MSNHSPASLRPYRPDDAPALLRLFRDTIRRINARDYAPDQIAAWASDEIDPEAWKDRFEGRFAIVAEIDGACAGFADLTPAGHLDRLFVSADHQRRGVASAMLSAMIAEARRLGLREVTVEASITAKPFFEAAGFREVACQSVVVRGVALTNYAMNMSLGA